MPTVTQAQPDTRQGHYAAAREWLARAERSWGGEPTYADLGEPNGSENALAATQIAAVHIMLGDRAVQ